MAVHSSIASKFSLCCTALWTGKQPWLDRQEAVASASSPTTRPGSLQQQRWFSDLLCLPVEDAAIQDPLRDAKVARHLLIQPGSGSDPASQVVRDNVRKLWFACIDAYTQRDESRRLNALRILIQLSDALLSKNLSAVNFISLLCSSISNADTDLLRFVEAINRSLQYTIPTSPIAWMEDREQLRTELLLTLRLIVVWASRAGQTSLSTAFSQRDLFPSISSILSSFSAFDRSVFEATDESGRLAAARTDFHRAQVLSSLALALLCASSLSSPEAAKYAHQIDYQAAFDRNPYRRRLADWVDMGTISRCICQVAAQTWTQDVIAAYERKIKDQNKQQSSLGSFFSGFFSLSPAPVSMTPAADEASTLPPASVCTLLPILFLSHLNGAFATAMMGDVSGISDQASPTSVKMAPHLALLSLSSFLHCHAAADRRSQSIARTSLATLASIVQYAPAELLLRPLGAIELAEMRLCVSRSSIVPAVTNPFATPNAKGKRPATQTSLQHVLHSAVIFLRNNQSKTFDAEGHLIALHIVSECVGILASTRTMLELDWSLLWFSLLNLAQFLASRLAEMQPIHQPGARLVAKQMLACLSAQLLESDRYLPTPKETHQFIYEIVRSSSTLRKLTAISLAPFSSVATSVPLGQTTRRSSGILPPSSPPAVHSDGGGDSGPIPPPPDTTAAVHAAAPLPARAYVEVPGWKVLELVIKTVEARLHTAVSPAAKASHLSGDAAAIAAGLTGNTTPTKQLSLAEAQQRLAASSLDVKTVQNVIEKLDLDILLAGANIDDLNLGGSSGMAGFRKNSLRSEANHPVGSSLGRRGSRVGGIYFAGSDLGTSGRSASPLEANAADGSADRSGSPSAGLIGIVKTCATDALRM